MMTAIPAFFYFLFAWNIFFHLLTFTLYVSLGLKWVSFRQNLYGSCFLIHSAHLCLLVGAFNQFTFKVLIDMSSVFSDSSLKIWKFMVKLLLKPGLENFENYFASTCSVQFSRSVMSESLQQHGPQHARPPCPLPTPRVYSNSYPLSP